MGRAGLLLALVVAGGLATAATSSTAIPTSTASTRGVQMTGGSLRGISYTVAAGTVTVVTVQIKGPKSLPTVVTARYGSGVAVPCVLGAYNLATDTTPATCAGVAEPAARPRALTLTVS